MVAYSFRPRFAEPILAGTKRQTIRAFRRYRSRHAHPGEELQLYTGMRTKHCRLVARARCTGTQPISIDFLEGTVTIGDDSSRTWLPQPDDRDAFARADGFADWSELVAFWEREHPEAMARDRRFDGVLVRWDPVAPVAPASIAAGKEEDRT